MQVHFIIHESFEGPGVFLTWAQGLNYTISSSKIFLGESLPVDNSAIDLLVILGGPQCPATTERECHYFSADKEIAFIRACINNDTAVVGVCLGAQLIGEALGATFEQSPEREIGYFPITLTDSGKQDAKLAHFNAVEVVGHWHNDMPGLTPSSKVLATSAGCPRQIVEYSPLVYGFQCHLEFTAESLTDLIAVSEHEFDDIGHHNYVQNPESIITNSNLAMNTLLFEFMDNLVHFYNDDVA
ncbi:glutamine amidotransferase-related protein [Colwellia psychrerythraea]|uniref:Glutamine amidotransferase type 1 n=1 Tax=Colwellia psychrerythraea TaxID=28229 RepID=A0A099KJH5_COLPS|nr:hypothetical protein [Colwellia psychrerythraea]KGJ90979.1 Glutamine amidotransferase type 1 [Colwellia psychrerythraea]